MSIERKIKIQYKHVNKYAIFSRAKTIQAIPLCRKPRHVKR